MITEGIVSRKTVEYLADKAVKLTPEEYAAKHPVTDAEEFIQLTILMGTRIFGFGCLCFLPNFYLFCNNIFKYLANLSE